MRAGARAAAAILLLVVLGGVAAAFAAPRLLQPRLAAAASRALGRPVTIADVHLLPAWPPTLVARNVQAPPVGSVERVEARLAPASLLTGTPRIADLLLIRPDLRDPSGAFEQPRRHSPAPALAEAPPSSVVHRSPVVQRVTIEQGHVQWTDPRAGKRVAATVSGSLDVAARTLVLHADMPAQAGYPAATLSLHATSGQPVASTLSFAWRGHPVQVRLDGGTPEQWRSRAPVAVSLNADAPGATLTAHGTFAWPRYDFAASLRADEAALSALAGWPPGLSGPVALDGHVTGEPLRVALRGLAFSSPQGDLSGSLALTPAPRATLVGTLASQRLDLDAVLAVLAEKPAPSLPAPPASPGPAPQPVSDRPLPFAQLRRADADLRLNVAALRLGGVEYHGLAGHLALQDGRLALDPFTAALPGGGALQAILHADATATPPTASVVLHMPSVAVAPVLAASHLPAWGSGSFSLDADLHGAGATPRALAASLDGTANLRLRDGTIDSGLLAALLGHARLPVAFPPGSARLTCLAVGATARAGVLTLAPLVAETDRLRIDGGGTVDLGREMLGLDLRPLLRTGPGLVVLVRVTGPWHTPKVAVGRPDGASPPEADRTACPPSQPATGLGRKAPKAIDILRGLLR